MSEFVWVDPAELYLPPSRPQGADPAKLARQISHYGRSLSGMPSLQLTRGKLGLYRINNGVTRATRAAKFQPGVLIEAEVIDNRPNLDVTRLPKVKDMLP